MDRWKDRVALVTGASAGIGARICRELVKYMTVVGCARNVQRIRDMSEEEDVKSCPGRLLGIRCDLTKESDILAMFDEIREKFGRIDVCINNAGIDLDANLLNGKTEDWRALFEVNVLALCICTREAVKLMKEKEIDDGHIIHISSLAAHDIPSIGWHSINFYCGTKCMVRALTEGLRRELTSENSHIRVSSISPGYVESEIIDRMYKDIPENIAELCASITPLKPQDIADSIVHILKSPPHVDINDIIVRPVDSLH